MNSLILMALSLTSGLHVPGAAKTNTEANVPVSLHKAVQVYSQHPNQVRIEQTLRKQPTLKDIPDADYHRQDSV